MLLKLTKFRFCNETIENCQTLSERDFVLLWNLMPANYEEAIALMPSLSATPQETIVKILTTLNEKRGMSRQN